MAFAPAVRRKEEALLMQNEAPMATRLRSHSKVRDAQIFQSEFIGGTDVNNQLDKLRPRQPSMHQHGKSNHSTVEKSEFHTSSPCKTGQPSTYQLAKKSNGSASIRSVCRTSGPKNNKDFTPRKRELPCRIGQHSKNQGAKSSNDTLNRTEIAITPPSRINIKDFKTKKNDIRVISSCRTSQPSENQGSKISKDTPKGSKIPITAPCRINSKDSMTKKNDIRVVSSCRASQPSDNQGAKSSKYTLKRSEIPITAPCRINSKDSTTTKNDVQVVSSCRTSQSSKNQSTESSKDTPKRSEIPITLPCRRNTTDSTTKKNDIRALSFCRTSQSSKNQSAKSSKNTPKGSEMPSIPPCRRNSKDATTKKNEIRVTLTWRRRLPSKDMGNKNSKDSSETQVKQHLRKQHAQSKGSQPKSEINASSRGRRGQYSENQKFKKSKTSTSDIHKPTPSYVWREKEKSTRPSEKLPKQSTEEASIHHIRCEDFGKAIQSVRWFCELCKQDVAESPVREELEYSLPPEHELWDSFFLEEEEYEHGLLPEVSVLPCSHVFHSFCVQQLPLFEEKLSDPSCPICV